MTRPTRALACRSHSTRRSVSAIGTSDAAGLEASVRVGPPVRLGRPIRRIAVFRANNVGDFVQGTPALRALRAAFPEAEITLVCSRRVRPLAERQPSIDRILEFPGFPGIRERAIDPEATLRFLAEAQASRYDVGLQLHGNGVWSNPFVALLGAGFTVGFVRAEDSPEFLGLDRALVYPEGRHEALRLLDLLGSIGVEPRGIEPEVFVCEEDEAEAEAVLAAAGLRPSPPNEDRDAGGAGGCPSPLVGLHPGGRFPDRMWPAERFAEVARALVHGHDARVVLTGAGLDAASTQATRLAAGVPVVDLTDRLSLPGLAALIARLDLFVSNDTGPAHLAYAAGTPSVTLFGAAPASEWGSFELDLHPAVEPAPPSMPGYATADSGASIDRIEPAAVLAHVDRLLALPARAAAGPRQPARAVAVPPTRHGPHLALGTADGGPVGS